MIEAFGTVFIVTPSAERAESIVDAIRQENLLVVSFDCAQDALEHLEDSDHDPADVVSIIVEETMPGVDGVSFTRKLHDRKLFLPMIWLTAKTDEKLRSLINLAKPLGAWLLQHADIQTRVLQTLKDAVREHRAALFKEEIKAFHDNTRKGLEEVKKVIHEGAAAQMVLLDTVKSAAKEAANDALLEINIMHLFLALWRSQSFRWFLIAVVVPAIWAVLDMRATVYATRRDIDLLLGKNKPAVTPNMAQPSAGP